MSRIGILGGSFNPPHSAHVALAVAALEQLELDRVLLVPAGQAPHKEIESDPGASVRLDLCRAAIDGIEGVEVSGIEVERGGRSFTVDTLRQLKAEDGGSELVLILGEDMALSLGSWREPEEMLSLANIAWTGRADGSEAIADRRERVADVVTGLGGGRPAYIDFDPMSVSSTVVRERCRAEQPIDGLVPEGVKRLIGELGLYRGGPGS